MPETEICDECMGHSLGNVCWVGVSAYKLDHFECFKAIIDKVSEEAKKNTCLFPVFTKFRYFKYALDSQCYIPATLSSYIDVPNFDFHVFQYMSEQPYLNGATWNLGDHISPHKVCRKLVETGRDDCSVYLASRDKFYFDIDIVHEIFRLSLPILDEYVVKNIRTKYVVTNRRDYRKESRLLRIAIVHGKYNYMKMIISLYPDSLIDEDEFGPCFAGLCINKPGTPDGQISDNVEALSILVRCGANIGGFHDEFVGDNWNRHISDNCSSSIDSDIYNLICECSDAPKCLSYLQKNKQFYKFSMGFFVVFTRLTGRIELVGTIIREIIGYL